jgi:hypothetical protein
MLGSLLLLLLSEKGICQIHESKPSPVQKVMEKIDVCFGSAGGYNLHGEHWIFLTILYAQFVSPIQIILGQTFHGVRLSGSSRK